MGSSAFILNMLTAVGIPLLLLRAYLDLNKKWSRKHIPEVANSISIASHMLIALTVLVFLLQSFLAGQVRLAVINAIGLVWNTAVIIIGTGVFVPENRDEGVWHLFLHSLRLERAESTNLLRTFSNPKGTREILHVLEGVAAVDHEIVAEEAALISQFAEAWRVPPPSLTLGIVPEGERVTLAAIRERVNVYLAVEPPPEQALQMLDLLRMLVEIDSDLSKMEEIILDEVNGLIHQYADDVSTITDIYEVRIIFQRPEQRNALEQVMPKFQTTRLPGADDVVIVGRYFSEQYAEIVSQKYRSLGLFTKAEVIHPGTA